MQDIVNQHGEDLILWPKNKIQHKMKSCLQQIYAYSTNSTQMLNKKLKDKN